ncbi:MAG: hypothetical protein QM640_06555 [Niabella sp.]
MVPNKNILLVIVLYNIKLEESKSYLTLLANSEEVNQYCLLVYDNSPRPQALSSLPLKVIYVHDSKNSGVSKGYNEGIKYGLKHKFQSVLLLDQDTEFPKGALDIYTKYLLKEKEISLFVPILLSNGAIYSPCRYIISKGFLWKNARPGKFVCKKKAILNSGTLLRLKSSILWFDERIKLYFSDFDFFMKFKKTEKYFFVLPIYANHTLSDIAEKNINAAKFRFRHYSYGAVITAKSAKERLFSGFWVFLRSIKLSILYKDIAFLTIFYKYYIKQYSADL